MITFIINKGDEQYLRHDKFILLEFEQIVAIISGLIYIEILELKFCELDYELKINIDKRSNEDSNIDYNRMDSRSIGDNIELCKADSLDDSSNKS